MTPDRAVAFVAACAALVMLCLPAPKAYPVVTDMKRNPRLQVDCVETGRICRGRVSSEKTKWRGT